MFLTPSSSAALRFFASIKDGRGLKPSARDAGIDKEVGYRWLREKYLKSRRDGISASETIAELGFTTSRLMGWEAEVERPHERNHLRVDADQEVVFWAAIDRGQRMETAAIVAGVARSTAYRWAEKRFVELRRSGMIVRRCTILLQLTGPRVAALERRRLASVRKAAAAATAAQKKAVASSSRYADRVLLDVATEGQKLFRSRRAQYWQLMRDGLSNADACRLLGMHPHNGTLLREAAKFQIPSLNPKPEPSGRYLDARERLQIADLLRLKRSSRKIAVELGWHPSTISRELKRHRRPSGDSLPASAQHDARQQRARPKTRKLVANSPLRILVQRRLNRFWSPDEISGWLRKGYPDDLSMRICPETIYRALLLRDGEGLHKRFALKCAPGDGFVKRDGRDDSDEDPESST